MLWVFLPVFWGEAKWESSTRTTQSELLIFLPLPFLSPAITSWINRLKVKNASGCVQLLNEYNFVGNDTQEQ